MNRFKYLPIGALVLALSGAGIGMAVAQTTGGAPETSSDEAPAERTEVSRDRGDHRGRGGHRGGKGFGMRGNSEIFRTVFAEVDADGDGSVTQDEVDAYRAAKVGEADASGDGALSIEEFDTLYRQFTRPRMVDAFQDLDADGDGVISPAEMDARFGDIVERMDRDGDGALTVQRGRRN